MVGGSGNFSFIISTKHSDCLPSLGRSLPLELDAYCEDSCLVQNECYVLTCLLIRFNFVLLFKYFSSFIDPKIKISCWNDTNRFRVRPHVNYFTSSETGVLFNSRSTGVFELNPDDSYHSSIVDHSYTCKRESNLKGPSRSTAPEKPYSSNKN